MGPRENTDLKNLWELHLITEGKHLNHCDSERYRAFRYYGHLRLKVKIDCSLMNINKLWNKKNSRNSLYTLNKFKMLYFDQNK